MFNKEIETAVNEVHTVLFEHKSYLEVWDELENLVERTKTFGRSCRLCLYGSSRNGKTSLLNNFKKEYPVVQRDDYDERKVLVLKAQPQMDNKSLVQAALDELEAPYSQNARFRDLKKLLTVAIKESRVLVVIIDEAQLIGEINCEDQFKQVCELLKYLSGDGDDSLNVSIVLCGTESMKKIFDRYYQMRSRFTDKVYLNRWSLDSDKGIEEFQSVVKSFLVVAGLKKGLDIIGEEDFIKRIHFATGGSIGNLAVLVAETVRLFMSCRSKELNLRMFDKAFKSKFWLDVRSDRNPFSKKFDFIELNNPGEPFYMEGY